MKSFNDFIEDSAKAENRDMAGEFWQLVARNDLLASELETFLHDKGYSLLPRDIANLVKIKDFAEEAFDYGDKAY